MTAFCFDDYIVGISRAASNSWLGEHDEQLIRFSLVSVRDCLEDAQPEARINKALLVAFVGIGSVSLLLPNSVIARPRSPAEAAHANDYYTTEATCYYIYAAYQELLKANPPTDQQANDMRALSSLYDDSDCGQFGRIWDRPVPTVGPPNRTNDLPILLGPQTNAPAFTPPKHHRSFVSSKVLDQLTLSAEQVAKLVELKREFARKQADWYEKQPNARGDQFKGLHAMRVEYRNKFREVLTASQKATYDKALDDAKKRMQGSKGSQDEDDDASIAPEKK